MSKQLTYSQRKAEIKKIDHALDVLDILKNIGEGTKLEMVRNYKKGGESRIRYGVEYLLSKGMIDVCETVYIPNVAKSKPIEIKTYSIRGDVYTHSWALNIRLEEIEQLHIDRKHKHGRSSLSEKQKAEIINIYSTSSPRVTMKQLAKIYEVSQTTIRTVISKSRELE